MTQTRAIGPWGTAARVGLGLLLLCLAFSDLTITEYSAPPWYAFAIGLGVLPAALLLFQWVRLRFTQESLNETGPIAHLMGIGITVALLSISVTQEATLLFYGVSLLLAAIRGYAGCEILAISNWLLRREDQIGCLLLSPLDAAEAQLSQRRAT